MPEQAVPDGIPSDAAYEPITPAIKSKVLPDIDTSLENLKKGDEVLNGVLLQPFKAEPNLLFRSDMMIRDIDVPFLFLAKKLMNLLAKSSVKLTDEGYLPTDIIDKITSAYLPKYNDLSVANTVANQLEFPSLNACLSVLQSGGWIRKYQGLLSLTKKGKQKHKILKGTKHNAWFLTELLQIYREKYNWQSEAECNTEHQALNSIHQAFPKLICTLLQANNKEVDSTWFLASITELKNESKKGFVEMNHVLVEHFFIRFAWRFGLVIKPKLGTDNVFIRQSKLFSKWVLIKD